MAPGGTVENVKSPCDWEDVEDIYQSDDAVPEGATVSPAYRALSRKIQGIHRFLEERASSLYCKKLMRIDHSKPGTALHTRFMQACAATNGKGIKLVFNGSYAHNIELLCRYGLDPKRRSTYGDWFAVNASTSASYCRGGQRMLVCAVLTGPEHAHAAIQPGGIIVLQRTEHHLPLFVLSFQTEPPRSPASPVASPTPAPVAKSPVQKDIGSPRVDNAMSCCWRGRPKGLGKGGAKRHR